MRLLTTAFLVLAPAVASASTWEIDSGHTTAQFTVKHMMVTNVRGEFGKVTGTVKLDDKDVSKSVVEATVDATTINTRNEKRDAHLRSADFFDVEKNPTLTFKSKKVEKAGDGKYKVSGDLTMHGVTKPVVLDVAWPGTEVKDPWGNLVTGLVATTTVSRKDFGLNWNKALEAGGVLVGDDVAIQLDIELKKQAPQTSKS